MPKVNPVPATPISAASRLQLWRATTAASEATGADGALAERDDRKRAVARGCR
jgi:hypothetical protein